MGDLTSRYDTAKGPGMAEDNLVETTLNDADLFAGAIAGEAPADVPVAETPDAPETPTEAKPADVARDASGRFAAKTDEPPKSTTETPPANQAAAPVEDNGGQIPAWRLREEAEARRRADADLATERAAAADLRRQLAQFQQPAPKVEQEKPDPLLDPQGFSAFIQNQFDEKLNNVVRNMQMAQSHKEHGKLFEDAYTEAQKAMASGDPILRERMLRSRNAGEELVSWHRERTAMREVGTDVEAYKTKVLEDALKDPAYLAKAIAAANNPGQPAQSGQQQSAVPRIELPPSLSGAARGSQTTGLSDTDMSDEALFKFATQHP